METAVQQTGDEGKALAVVKWVADKGIEGGIKLAEEFLRDRKYASNDDRVTSLIRWQATYNFGSGFLTGLGGLATLPVAVPAALGASWYLQARLAAAIAIIYGHDPYGERFRTLVLLCLLGNKGKEALKRAGITVGNKITQNVIAQIPGKLLIEINKQVGFRLLTKAGHTGVINLTKVVPVVGGVVGGSIDAAACLAVGRVARELFGQNGSAGHGGAHIESADGAGEAEPIQVDPAPRQPQENRQIAAEEVTPFCPNCETEAEGVFCSECGTKLIWKVRSQDTLQEG